MDDAARFRTLFDATIGAVRRYVHHRGVTGGRADDVVAETFLVAWRRLDEVPDDDPVPWLLAVARNVWRMGPPSEAPRGSWRQGRRLAVAVLSGPVRVSSSVAKTRVTAGPPPVGSAGR